MPRLSVVIPMLNEEPNIPALYAALRETLESVPADFEIIFVDDGSTDRSAAAVTTIHDSDRRVKLLCLSRNFGHQNALTAGMDFATGDAVVTMDADLQHPPALIPELYRLWNQGFEIVSTVRQATPSARPLKKWSASLFYAVFRHLSGIDLPANSADFRLFDRKVVDAFRELRERTRFLRGLVSWVGYRSAVVPYEAPARYSGRSKYGLRKMLRFAVDGLVSFSATPLYVAIYLGLALAVAGFCYLLFVLYSRFVTNDVVAGWTSLIVIVMLVGGVQLSLMGIIGIYIGRIYEEVKRRPLYLLTGRLGFEDARSDASDSSRSLVR